jgi:glycosyltransferase involved in cell wall biosynthesis
MRVALLTNFIAPYRLPVFRALAAQVGALRILVSTAMAADRDWAPDWQDLDVVAQRTITFRRPWGGAGFREWVELHVPLDTGPQLRRFKPDVVLSGEFGFRSIGAARYTQSTGVPLVLWATVSDRLETAVGRTRNLIRQRLLQRAKRVIVNGENGARYLRRFQYPDVRIARIPQTADLELFLPLSLERPGDSAPRLLCVGHVSERKGVSLLIDAIAANPRLRQTQVTIVGDGPLRAQLQQRTQHHGLPVTWAGSVPYHELPRWYAQSDFLIFPTLGDEWGLVVNEAMAAGLPVIGSRYSQAVEELVRDGENGWIFTADNANAVGAAIERAFQAAPAEILPMRSRARATVAPLTPQHIASRFYQILRESLTA